VQGFAGEICAVNILWVEDIPKFVTGKTIKFGVIGIHIRPEDGTSVLREIYIFMEVPLFPHKKGGD